MKAKGVIGMALAMAAMAATTVNNATTGQTIQQQQIAEELRYQARFAQRKGVVRHRRRIGNPLIQHNQRQKRKRWRQTPRRRPIQNRHS